jgi:hypothetical protein
MNGYEKLAEHHILEHRFRQLKLEEVDRLARQEWGNAEPENGETGLDNWRQSSVNQAGPMGLIDILAQDLESFVELFEHAPRCEIPKPLGLSPHVRRS